MCEFKYKEKKLYLCCARRRSRLCAPGQQYGNARRGGKVFCQTFGRSLSKFNDTGCCKSPERNNRRCKNRFIAEKSSKIAIS